MKTRILYLLLGCLATWPVFSQYLPFRAYTVSQGLATNAIRAIYQDRDGFIWIATWEGLSKYDGYRFTNYSIYNGLPHSMVNDVAELADSSLVVVMNDGSISTIKNGKIKLHTYKGAPINQLFKTGSGQLLAITDKHGLYRVDNGRFNKISTQDSSTLYAFNGFSPGWYIGAGDMNIVTLYNSRFEPVFHTDPNYFIPTAVLRDRSGRVWIGTESGLKLLHVETSPVPAMQWVNLPDQFNSKILSGGSISSIYEEEDGSLWFGTWEGLVRVDPKGAIEVYDEKDGLPSRKISCIFRDREKNLWIGTYAGLAKFAHPSVEKIKLPGDSPNASLNYTLLSPRQGELFLVSGSNIFHYTTAGGTFKTIFFSPGHVSMPILTNKMYTFINGSSVYEFDTLTNKVRLSSVNNSHLLGFSAARKDSLLVVGRADKLLIQIGNRIIDTFNNHRIHTVYIDSRNRIWAGAWTDGLYLVEMDFREKKIKKITDYTPYVSSPAIRTLLEDSRGNIWVGTRYNGINIIPANGETGSIRYITQQDGLSSNWVYCFGEGPGGVIWVGSLGGINKLIPSGKGYRVFNFSRVMDYFSTVSNMVVENGNILWCTTDKGLLRITDSKLEQIPPMDVFITQMQVANRDSNYFSASPQKEIRITYKENNVHFEFTSPGFINENELQYRYRLIGSDTNWSIASNVHSVQYASLKPGKYRFEVCMIGWNGEAGRVTALPFVVAAPFWQTTWFYALLALGIVFLFYLFYRYRIRQLLKLQRVRNNIATDLHDDIGASLTNINILSRLSLQHIHEPENAKKFLTRISEQVQGSSEALDDIIWSVNTRHDSMSEILARMRRHAADLFDHTEISCHLSLPEFADDSRLSMELRRDLFLVYKELLNNINKHAGAKTVRVSLQKTGKEIRLTVSDDGKGFDYLEENDRNGLKNMQARAKKWNGSLHFESMTGKGTTVTVIFLAGD